MSFASSEDRETLSADIVEAKRSIEAAHKALHLAERSGSATEITKALDVCVVECQRAYRAIAADQLYARWRR